VCFRDVPGTLEDPSNAGYNLNFLPDGSFNLHSNVGGVITDLVGYSVYASTFEQGLGTNHLTIIAQSPRIAVYMNREPLWFVHDESSSRGRISLAVHSGVDKTTLRVYFDNLKVWDITDLPLP